MLSRRLLPAVVLALAAVAGTAGTASAKTVIFNLYPAPLTKPAKIFLQANSGPFINGLNWSGWGAERATGTGTWTLDCSHGGSACAPGDPALTTYPARYVLSKLSPCPRFGARATSYRKGTLEIDKDGTTVKRSFPSDYDFCARPPSRSAAREGVRRHLVRKRHVHDATIACTPQKDGVNVDCTARWKPGKSADFVVYATMRRPVVVTQLGS